MTDLRISLIQGDTRWHDPAGNLAYYGGLLEPLAGQTDLVILPETFTSGFPTMPSTRPRAWTGRRWSGCVHTPHG